jgi:hypothetical protein
LFCFVWNTEFREISSLFREITTFLPNIFCEIFVEGNSARNPTENFARVTCIVCFFNTKKILINSWLFLKPSGNRNRNTVETVTVFAQRWYDDICIIDSCILAVSGRRPGCSRAVLGSYELNNALLPSHAIPWDRVYILHPKLVRQPLKHVKNISPNRLFAQQLNCKNCLCLADSLFVCKFFALQIKIYLHLVCACSLFVFQDA